MAVGANTPGFQSCLSHDSPAVLGHEDEMLENQGASTMRMAFRGRRRRDIHRNQDLPSGAFRPDRAANASLKCGRSSRGIRNRGTHWVLSHRRRNRRTDWQCSHNLPGGFANSTISRTLQHKLHSAQALPGISGMGHLPSHFARDSNWKILIRQAAGARAFTARRGVMRA